MLRPPFAHDAVQALPDGPVRVHFKAPWRIGATHADMTPDHQMMDLRRHTAAIYTGDRPKRSGRSASSARTARRR